jgi:hypothetical protein
MFTAERVAMIKMRARAMRISVRVKPAAALVRGA